MNAGIWLGEGKRLSWEEGHGLGVRVREEKVGDQRSLKGQKTGVKGVKDIGDCLH